MSRSNRIRKLCTELAGWSHRNPSRPLRPSSPRLRSRKEVATSTRPRSVSPAQQPSVLHRLQFTSSHFVAAERARGLRQTVPSVPWAPGRQGHRQSVSRGRGAGQGGRDRPRLGWCQAWCRRAGGSFSLAVGDAGPIPAGRRSRSRRPRRPHLRCRREPPRKRSGR